jgi:hypothetical protein
MNRPSLVPLVKKRAPHKPEFRIIVSRRHFLFDSRFTLVSENS